MKLKGNAAKAAAALLIAFTAAAASFGATRFTAPGRLFTLKGTDLLTRLLADPARADDRIAIVEVDQASLDYFEEEGVPFPWPRSLYNALIEYCNAGGAKALIFDTAFELILVIEKLVV